MFVASTATAALVDICIDDQRHILYTRSQASVLQVGGERPGGERRRRALHGRPRRLRTRLTQHLQRVAKQECRVRPRPIASLPGLLLQVFDLGADGSAAPAKVAESSEFLHDAARALGGRDVFGRGGECCQPFIVIAFSARECCTTRRARRDVCGRGGAPSAGAQAGTEGAACAGRQPQRRRRACTPFPARRPPCKRSLPCRLFPRPAGGDRKGAAVVYMAPIPPSQSHRLHLLTVTADGRRVYWAAASSRYGNDRESLNPASCAAVGCVCGLPG